MGKVIIVDPAKLESTAVKIEGFADEYKKQYELLFMEIEGLTAWQGADNQAYVTQVKGFTDDFQKMYGLMKEYAKFLRESATAYKNTQSEIISAAKKLSN